MTKHYYAVECMITKAHFETLHRPVVFPEGFVGMLPVFETREQAKEYYGDGEPLEFVTTQGKVVGG